jgi:prepilin-type N-terminal cleavage/methylation domain-containing protein
VFTAFNKPKSLQKGFTIFELLITLAIVGILTGTFVATWMGSKATDEIDRTAQRIYDDLVYMRSRAISVNQLHRMNFTSDSSWQLEEYDEVATTWSIVDEVRNMHPDINLTSITFANAGANLEAATSGLYAFQGSAVGTPFVTLESSSSSNTKSIIVAVGGALEFQTN